MINRPETKDVAYDAGASSQNVGQPFQLWASNAEQEKSSGSVEGRVLTWQRNWVGQKRSFD